MQKTADDQIKTREQLKVKRNRLFNQYFKNPANIYLAIEIRMIDDRVAEIAERLVEQRKPGLE